LACQRRTGGAFGIAAFYDEGRVSLEGPATRFRRDSESGMPVDFFFCPKCGSTVYWFPHRKPGRIAVAVGAFADPDFPAPRQGVHRETRHPWLDDTP
jgi:hypothetical protein